jgi:hypothetical protein
MSRERAWAPHCDQSVLHAPGVCEHCDKYPDWQELRERWRINFTGENDDSKSICPSEWFRDLGTIHAWGGNTPA